MLKIKYFVLKPDSHHPEHARASRNALREYAKTIRSSNLQLASDIEEWISSATQVPRETTERDILRNAIRTIKTTVDLLPGDLK